MRPEPRDPATAAEAAFARQVAVAAARLRQEGVPPAHDLWPGISQALDAAAAEAGGDHRPRPFRPARQWPAAALAASVLLAIGLGLSGWRDTMPVAGGPQAAAPAASRATTGAPRDTGATRDGLRVVGDALDELQAALAQAPDDPDLSRLVLMIHHSRGRLLRLQADGGARDARRSPA